MGSLAAAAQRLGVTPGAVSQHLRQLEDRVGTALLLRSRHGVTLTPAGALMHAKLVAAFDQIESSLDQVTQLGRHASVTISTVPSFAASWLVPRLGDFHARHADIDVRVEASAELVNLRGGRIDFAIRHGLGVYPGLHSEHQLAPVLLPVASPSLLQRGPELRKPADCLRYPLLHDSDRADWKLWLQAHEVPLDSTLERGPAFEDDLLLLRAAAAGQGIALVGDAHARDHLAEGKLVVVLNLPWPARFAYYLVGHAPLLERAAVQQLWQWIAAQAREALEASPATAG